MKKLHPGIYRAPKPLRNEWQGKQWRMVDIILPNGLIIKGYDERKMSHKFFFPYLDHWYTGERERFSVGEDTIVYDLRNG